MSLLSIAAAAALLILLFWSSFSFVARVAGSLIVIDSLLTFVLGSGRPERLVWLAAGVGLWIGGHWMWALKYRAWKSALALRIFELPLLRYLAPIDRRPFSTQRGAIHYYG